MSLKSKKGLSKKLANGIASLATGAIMALTPYSLYANGTDEESERMMGEQVRITAEKKTENDEELICEFDEEVTYNIPQSCIEACKQFDCGEPAVEVVCDVPCYTITTGDISISPPRRTQRDGSNAKERRIVASELEIIAEVPQLDQETKVTSERIEEPSDYSTPSLDEKDVEDSTSLLPFPLDLNRLDDFLRKRREGLGPFERKSEEPTTPETSESDNREELLYTPLPQFEEPEERDSMERIKDLEDPDEFPRYEQPENDNDNGEPKDDLELEVDQIIYDKPIRIPEIQEEPEERPGSYLGPVAEEDPMERIKDIDDPNDFPRYDQNDKEEPENGNGNGEPRGPIYVPGPREPEDTSEPEEPETPSYIPRTREDTPEPEELTPPRYIQRPSNGNGNGNGEYTPEPGEPGEPEDTPKYIRPKKPEDTLEPEEPETPSYIPRTREDTPEPEDQYEVINGRDPETGDPISRERMPFMYGLGLAGGSDRNLRSELVIGPRAVFPLTSWLSLEGYGDLYVNTEEGSLLDGSYLSSSTETEITERERILAGTDTYRERIDATDTHTEERTRAEAGTRVTVNLPKGFDFYVGAGGSLVERLSNQDGSSTITYTRDGNLLRESEIEGESEGSRDYALNPTFHAGFGRRFLDDALRLSVSAHRNGEKDSARLNLEYRFK